MPLKAVPHIRHPSKEGSWRPYAAFLLQSFFHPFLAFSFSSPSQGFLALAFSLPTLLAFSASFGLVEAILSSQLVEQLTPRPWAHPYLPRPWGLHIAGRRLDRYQAQYHDYFAHPQLSPLPLSSSKPLRSRLLHRPIEVVQIPNRFQTLFNSNLKNLT